ncbi:beta-glucosidase BglX [Tenacibaculum amylolyticum]|uniref:beta-glucosidase BglX n=1 Tax=Tenacibaculum amylolyticum TaxID=104269 RepID=UPI0038938F13
MKKNTLIISIILLAIIGCQKSTGIKEGRKDIDRKVDSVLNLMTLEEKIGQMNQYNGFWDVTGPVPSDGDAAKKYEHLRKGLVGSMLNVRGVANVKKVQKIAVEESRLGIPLIIGFDVIHGYETQSPIPIAESASWDLEAIKKSAAMAAKEAAAAGINWTFAPMVDISRDPRWGRVMEGAGEDTFLGSKIAVARVKGFQGEDLSSPATLAACAKHFAAYGFAESGKDYNTVDVGTSTLYNTILPPFKAAKDADVKTFMNAFNELNGIPATGNAFLQREILKGRWNFKGFVVSDWGSIMEMMAHGYVKDKKDAADLAVKAGSDMDMESYAYINELAELVNDGSVKESLIDDAVRRILKVKFELGLFEDPYKYCNEEREKSVIGSKEIQEAALDIAKKSIVLLKNENKVLPLKKSGQKIALIGGLAADKNSPLGSWRLAAKDNSAISVLEGMQKYKENELIYAEGASVAVGATNFINEVQVNLTDTSKFNKAIEAAKKSDVVVMVLGEVGFQSGEARSSTSLDLPGIQQELLEAVYQVNKNIVLVLNNGRPLTINWAEMNIPAIVEAWQLGSQTGNAVAQVLYGDYNPSGKLPMTFPRSVGQIPIYYNYKNTGRPGPKKEVFWSHYQDETNKPLYPFGYGLSYTTFSYNDIQVSTQGKNVKVIVNVTNTGEVEGKEVVQLYIRDMIASVTRPVKELKGFELITLKPKETKTVTFTLTEKELGFFNNTGAFIVEPGEFKVFVGGSSDTSLETSFDFL